MYFTVRLNQADEISPISSLPIVSRRQATPLNIDVTLCVVKRNVTPKARSSWWKNVPIYVSNPSIMTIDFPDFTINLNLPLILKFINNFICGSHTDDLMTLIN